MTELCNQRTLESRPYMVDELRGVYPTAAALIEWQEARIALLNAVIREHREAMAELLSGHDNLYRAHWGHLPTCRPEDDIAAKAARDLLSTKHF